MSMFETFEAFADIDQLIERLGDSDSAVRQIAVKEYEIAGKVLVLLNFDYLTYFDLSPLYSFKFSFNWALFGLSDHNNVRWFQVFAAI